MSNPVDNGKKLYGPRYDEKLDSLCLKLGLKCANLQLSLGYNHPQYRAFLKEEYEPTMKKVHDYLAGNTDKHPSD